MSGKSVSIAPRKLVSIWPIAANTDSPNPSETTTDCASRPGPPSAPKAARKLGTRRAALRRANRRDERRIPSAANNNNAKATMMPPAAHKVSETSPDRKAAAPTSAAKIPAQTHIHNARGHPDTPPRASRNSAAARMFSVCASGHNVNSAAASAP